MIAAEFAALLRASARRLGQLRNKLEKRGGPINAVAVSMKKRRQKRVLIALGWYDYRLHSGIEKYAQEHGWHLSANLAREKVILWGWEGDGILAWLGAGDDLADFVRSEKSRRWI